MKTMVRDGALAASVMLLICGSASAANRGSPEDQLACTPDVYRLCSSYVPDEDAIVACLQKNVRVLTPACQRVMTRPDTPAGGESDEDTD